MAEVDSTDVVLKDSKDLQTVIDELYAALELVKNWIKTH